MNFTINFLLIFIFTKVAGLNDNYGTGGTSFDGKGLHCLTVLTQ